MLANGMSEEAIDGTRVLPELSVDVGHYKLWRDLPPFPEEPLKVFGMAIDDKGARKWDAPEFVGLKADGPETGNEMAVLFCPKSGCKTYGCTLHGKV